MDMNIIFDKASDIVDVFNIVNDIKTEYNLNIDKNRLYVNEFDETMGSIGFNMQINFEKDKIKLNHSQLKIGISDNNFYSFINNLSSCGRLEFKILKNKNNILILEGDYGYMKSIYNYKINDVIQCKQFPNEEKFKNLSHAEIIMNSNTFYKLIKSNKEYGKIYNFTCTQNDFQIQVYDSKDLINSTKFNKENNEEISIKLCNPESNIFTINVQTDDLIKIVKCQKICQKIKLSIYKKFIIIDNDFSNGKFNVLITGLDENQNMNQDNYEEEDENNEEEEDENNEEEEDENNEEEDEEYDD